MSKKSLNPSPHARRRFKIPKYAKVLAMMAEAKILSCKEVKPIVMRCIRTASETYDYHNSVDYRSKEVVQKTKHLKPVSSAYHRFCSKNFRHEHIVPCQVQYELLVNLPHKSEQNIKDFLNNHSLRATITKNQNNKLNNSGFRSKMPDGFDDKDNKELFENPLARYIESGIFESLEKYEPIK